MESQEEILLGAEGNDDDLKLQTKVLLSSSTERPQPPDMWSKDFIGFYSSYGAIGLVYGMGPTIIPFCAYVYEGEANVCSNARSIVYFAWSLKVVVAMLTDCYRPFGKRRVAWMMFGWTGVMTCLLILAIFAKDIGVSAWLGLLMCIQGFIMFVDVPADGYGVEIGQLESHEQRGQVVVTAQRIRFTFCILTASIQTFLLNGPETSPDDCPINFSNCWSWGLTINEYYGLLLVITFILTIPVYFLKELDGSSIPYHSFKELLNEVWKVLQNLTTFYLVIFVLGLYSFTHFSSRVNTTMQFYIIELTNFQTGLDSLLSYVALVGAIYVFQTYLIRRNWRITEYFSNIVTAVLGLLWIFVYYDVGGLQNAWFTIFVDIDEQFSQGISQVLYSIAVIELAAPGAEATTQELIASTANAAYTLNGVLATQLLFPLDALACTDDDGNCPSNSVEANNKESFEASDGPNRYRNYALILCSIAIAGSIIFVPFLPASREMCYEWKLVGEKEGLSKRRGYIALAMVTFAISYGFVASVLELDSSTSCLEIVGGTGC